MKDRGKLIGYIPKQCDFCERLRVELWENGDRICEKCGYNQDTDEFEEDYNK